MPNATCPTDTIRQGVLTLLNVGPRDPTLLLVRCGVCGTVATLSSTLTRPMGRPTRGAFSSSRQASASNLLPSPTPLVARAKRQLVPRYRRSVAAPASLLPRSSTSKDSRPICCGSGHSPASLVTFYSDASWHLHSVPPSAHKARALRTSSSGVCPRSYS